MNKTEIEEAAKEFFEKLFPKCSIERSSILKHGHNYYEIEAEMEPKPGCPSYLNPSRRYNLKLQVKATLIKTPLGKLKP